MDAKPLNAASIAIAPREIPRKISGRCGFQFIARIVRYRMWTVDQAHGGRHECEAKGILLRMAVSDEFLQYVLEQLEGLGTVTVRRMFGAVGLYHGDRFFALISRDTL